MNNMTQNVKYRDLKIGEVIQEGDEILSDDFFWEKTWFKPGHIIGGFFKHRRPLPCPLDVNEPTLTMLGNQLREDLHAATWHNVTLSQRNNELSAEIARLTEELVHAATYTEGLERDVALLSSVQGEEITPKDTIFLRVKDGAKLDECMSFYDTLQASFPQSKIITLPEGLDLHAIAKING